MKWNYILRFTKSNQFDLPNLKTFEHLWLIYYLHSVCICIFFCDYIHFFTDHCVKSVQIRSFFWSVFSSIQSEYRKIRTRNNSIFGHFTQLMSQWIVQGNTLSFIFIWNINLSRSNPERREKIKLNFYFRTSLRCLIKVFIKPFEAPQGSVKIKI